MICSQAGCHNPALPYRYALGHRETTLCIACHDGLTAIGMVLRPVERRTTDRPFRAPWLARLTARDESQRTA